MFVSKEEISRKEYFFAHFAELPPIRQFETEQMRNVKGRKPKSDINDLHLIHFTRYFPQDGEIHPRQSISSFPEIRECEEKKADKQSILQ